MFVGGLEGVLETLGLVKIVSRIEEVERRDGVDPIDSLLRIFGKLIMTFPFECSMMLSISVFACGCRL